MRMVQRFANVNDIKNYPRWNWDAIFNLVDRVKEAE